MTDDERRPQPDYLMRGRIVSRTQVVQTSTPFVRHAAVHSAVGHVGSFTEVAVSGVDRAHVEITSRDTLNGNGRGVSTVRARAAKTAAGVKSVLRRLRPQERERLDEIDARIEEARAHLVALQRERAEIVSEAWSKAHVVRVNELELADDPKIDPRTKSRAS